jgi:hypothetical protein
MINNKKEKIFQMKEYMNPWWTTYMKLYFFQQVTRRSFFSPLSFLTGQVDKRPLDKYQNEGRKSCYLS